MASLGGGRILKAREGAFFKSEQEGDLHQYLKRRVAEGKIKLSDDELKLIQGGGSGSKAITSREEERVYEVGMEILQQKARYETLDAKTRAAIRRRVKAVMPEAREEDIYRISTNMAMYGAAGAMYGAHHGGRLPLGGGRRALQQLSRESARQGMQQPKALSPEASDAMRRQFMAGLRALTYGSLVGLVGVTAAVTLAANAFEIGDASSLRANIKAAMDPFAASVSDLARVLFAAEPSSGARATVAAAAAAARAGTKDSAKEAKGGSIVDSEFAKKLRERFKNFKL